jgi:GNAT superfamily N-acetyltransferase
VAKLSNNSYKIILQPPLPEAYCYLRKICGLSERSLSGTKEAMPRSIFAVTIYDNDKLIAMGRLIGDLGCSVQIVDIAVHPEYQKQGLSRVVMEHIMEFINKHVPTTATVCLFADVDYLYKKFGFIVPDNTTGMILSRK